MAQHGSSGERAFQVTVGPAQDPVTLEVQPAAGDLKP